MSLSPDNIWPMGVLWLRSILSLRMLGCSIGGLDLGSCSAWGPFKWGQEVSAFECTSSTWGCAWTLDVPAMGTVYGKETATAVSLCGPLASSGVPSRAVPITHPVSRPFATCPALTLALGGQLLGSCAWEQGLGAQLGGCLAACSAPSGSDAWVSPGGIVSEESSLRKMAGTGLVTASLGVCCWLSLKSIVSIWISETSFPVVGFVMSLLNLKAPRIRYLLLCNDSHFWNSTSIRRKRSWVAFVSQEGLLALPWSSL